MIVHRQLTEHGTELQLREEPDAPQQYVEVTITNDDYDNIGIIFLSLTPAEARAFADALLSSSQRVEYRQPHGNT